MLILKQYAMSFLGLPYNWGGDDPIEGFDCSGLVVELMQSCGELPRNYDNTAQGLYNHFVKNGLLSTKAFGSLAFFGRSTSYITHIGFMVDDFRMLEAGGGGSKTNTRQDAANQNAVIRIRPLSWRNDLVAVLRPKYTGLTEF